MRVKEGTFLRRMHPVLTPKLYFRISMIFYTALSTKILYSTSTRPGEGAIYRYLSRQGKIAGDIHETKSSGLSLS